MGTPPSVEAPDGPADIASPTLSNDPTNGITKDTPLGLRFWCHDIERLLCADEVASRRVGQLVPNVDDIVVVGNTSMYGGSGGDITTVAGRNAAAAPILPHELGHSIGKLGDEYATPYGKASGVESTWPNVSRYSASSIKTLKVKWYRWIGTTSPDGGAVGSYVGADHYSSGLNRPSKDSIMRSLGRAFNSIGREKVIEGAYLRILPVDKVTRTDVALTRTQNVTFSAPYPGHTRSITWRIDGTTVKAAATNSPLSATKKTLLLRFVRLSSALHTVSLTVSDPTPWVRDSTFHSTNMTERFHWTIPAIS